MADIFLSYKREDRAQVAPLTKALETEGLDVWWDEELPLGKSFAASISQELAAAKVVMPVWTARSVVSEWVQEEATFGKKRGNLIPVRLEPVDPPIGFGMVQTADLSAWRAGDRADPQFLNLLGAVRATIDKRPQVWPATDVAKAPAARRKLRFRQRAFGAVLAVIFVAAAGALYLHWQLIGVFEDVAPPTKRDSDVSFANDQNVVVEDFAFSPDGKTAASAGTDGIARLLDAATGKEMKRFAPFGPQAPRLGGSGPPAPHVAFSKTGQYITIAAADGAIAIVEIATGETKGRFATANGLIDMALAPDDGSLATLGNDGTVRVYQIDGKLLTQFAGRQNKDIAGIAWCPESDCLLIWGKDAMLEVWDPFKPALVDSLKGHAGALRAAAFSHDGLSFATIGDDRLLIVWNAKIGQPRLTLAGLEEPPLALAWSRDSERIAVETRSGKAFVWSTEGGAPKIVGPRNGQGRGWIAFTPDGKSVVLGGWPRGPRSAPIAD